MVVNGENSAGGVGITEKTARELLEMGADAITLGNHAYRHREVYGFLDREERIVRPANFPKGSPGRGPHGGRERTARALGVINLSGQLFLEAVRSPFSEADAILVRRSAARPTTCWWTCTPRPRARRWRSAGTSTAGSRPAWAPTPTCRPPTLRVLPGGTAYVTDVGMTGPRGGVIGVKREQAIERFLTLTNVRFETSTRTRG